MLRAYVTRLVRPALWPTLELWPTDWDTLSRWSYLRTEDRTWSQEAFWKNMSRNGPGEIMKTHVWSVLQYISQQLLKPKLSMCDGKERKKKKNPLWKRAQKNAKPPLSEVFDLWLRLNAGMEAALPGHSVFFSSYNLSWNRITEVLAVWWPEVLFAFEIMEWMWIREKIFSIFIFAHM